MFVDLQNIFTYTAETETSTSSQTLTKEVTASKVFTDEVVKNIDTRWYVNNNTKILYGFINKEYLLITSGEESFIDIVNKLTKNNILR
jgi:hypothetical protein